MSEDVYKDPLISKMWQTKGSRFIAYARLQRKHRLSLFTISILSMYITAISVLLLSSNDFNFGISSESLSSIAVIASLFVVALSQYENSKNYLVRADHMHTCALEILSLYTKLEAELSLAIAQEYTEEKIYALKAPYIEKYNNILMRYPENHDEVDYKLFCSNNPLVFKKYADFKLRIAEKIIAWLGDRWLYFLCMAIPPFFFLLASLPIFCFEKNMSHSANQSVSTVTEQPLDNTKNTP